MGYTDWQRLEKFLQSNIFPELKEGRPGWDKPHTESVVHYFKEIIHHTPDLSIDFAVVLIAAYAHDWGYVGLFHKGEELKLQQILDVKKQHMEIGVQKVTKLLRDPFVSFLNDQQKVRIIHLVGIHDQLNLLKDTDEFILMEADTLGALDTDRIVPFSDKESSDRYLQGVEKKRKPLFITNYGKSKLQELYKKRLEYYRHHV